MCELIWFHIMTVKDLKTGCDRLIVRKLVGLHALEKTRVLSKACRSHTARLYGCCPPFSSVFDERE